MVAKGLLCDRRPPARDSQIRHRLLVEDGLSANRYIYQITFFTYSGAALVIAMTLLRTAIHAERGVESPHFASIHQ